MRKLIATTAAVLAAVVVWLLVTLPPAPRALSLEGVDPELRARTITGAYHIHTTRSDGTAGKTEIAAAAARAGLQFAIFTDHGDGTRTPDPPAYVGRVLCLDAVEISTNGGHYVALGLPGATPYRLGGEAAAVVEDVARLGGFGIAAHPDHPRPALAWTDWSLPIDGVEWINADAEWRDESSLALARVIAGYPLRPGPALASVFDRPSRTLARWDDLNRARLVVGLAAVDAHGGARSGSKDDGEPGASIGPGYDATFRTLSNRLVLERTLTGDAATDATLVLDAIRRGSVYSVVDAISPDVVMAPEPTGFAVRSPLPASARAVTIGHPDLNRMEIEQAGAPGDPPVPWVLTNWIGRRSPPAAAVATLRGPSRPLTVGDWRMEKDEGSSGGVTAASGAAALEFQLREGERLSQYVALVADLARPGPFSDLSFQGRASRPMRVSVQLRFPGTERRWIKSVYLDPAAREVIVSAGGFRPAEPDSGRMPEPATARSLLFVVDLVNARPGETGVFTISDLRVR